MGIRGEYTVRPSAVGAIPVRLEHAKGDHQGGVPARVRPPASTTSTHRFSATAQPGPPAVARLLGREKRARDRYCNYALSVSERSRSSESGTKHGTCPGVQAGKYLLHSAR